MPRAKRSEGDVVKKDIIAGAFLLAVVAAFWVQRDFNGKLEAAFPEFVLISLSALAVVIIVLGVLRGDRTPGRRDVDLRFLGAAIAVVLAWAVGVGVIGFTITGVIAFAVMAQLIRRGRPQVPRLALDAAVALVVVVGVFLIFTRVLLVPLPVSTLINM